MNDFATGSGGDMGDIVLGVGLPCAVDVFLDIALDLEVELDVEIAAAVPLDPLSGITV